MGQLLPRPAAAAEPVGERGPLGAAPAPLPAHQRVPLAGGPHRPCERRRRRRLRPADPPRRLPRLPRRHPGAAALPGPQDRRGALRRRDQHDGLRGDHARPQSAAAGDQPRARPELRPRLRHHLHGRGRRGPDRLDDLLGRLDPPRRRPDHGTRRRAGAAPAAADRADPGGDRRRPRRGRGGRQGPASSAIRSPPPASG